jgi:hypothetical protein
MRSVIALLLLAIVTGCASNPKTRTPRLIWTSDEGTSVDYYAAATEDGEYVKLAVTVSGSELTAPIPNNLRKADNIWLKACFKYLQAEDVCSAATPLRGKR